MKYFLASLIVSLALPPFCGPVLAEKGKPMHLGSILDPEDDARVKREAKSEKLNETFVLDQEYPELPDVIRWELALTTKAFKVSDNLRTRSDLITAASKGVEYLCLSALQSSFSQTVPPEDPTCLKLLQTLEQLDPDSPVARCTRFGIYSDSCVKAYKAQQTVKEIPAVILSAYLSSQGKKFIPTAFENDLSVRLERDKARAALDKIRKEFEKLPKPDKRDKKFSELEEKRNTLLSQYLQTGCALYRLVTIPAKVVKDLASTKSSHVNKVNDKAGKSLEQLLAKGPFKEAKNAEKDAEPENHFRLMDAQCLQALSYVEGKNPSLPSIPCRRQGFTSPACITARSATPSPGNKAVAPAPRSVTEGIERF